LFGVIFNFRAARREEGSICPLLESPRVSQFEGKYELEGVKRSFARNDKICGK
jgi:hypothetical protein